MNSPFVSFLSAIGYSHNKQTQIEQAYSAVENLCKATKKYSQSATLYYMTGAGKHEFERASKSFDYCYNFYRKVIDKNLPQIAIGDGCDGNEISKIATSLIIDSGIAAALIEPIQFEIEKWSSWYDSGIFDSNKGFNATNIYFEPQKKIKEPSEMNINVSFLFQGMSFRFIAQNLTSLYQPVESKHFADIDGEDILRTEGFVHLWHGDKSVANLAISCVSVGDDYTGPVFKHIKTLRIGPWIKDVIHMSAQIEAKKTVNNVIKGSAGLHHKNIIL